MMRRLLIPVWIILSLFFIRLAPAQQRPLTGLDEYIHKALKEWEVPGLAIAIVKDDSIVHMKGYGVQKLGSDIPVNEQTVFAIASTSKAITSAALGILVDEGKIKWNDPATKYLKGFQLFDPYVTRELTIRDLLCHRSGLSRGDMIWFSSGLNREEVLSRVRYLEPSWSFRSQYGYQNIMFLAAGEIIPAATDTTWDSFVTERIFKPLGMKSSTTTLASIQGKDNVATPHAYIDDKVQPIPWVDVDNIGPAGSINSCVRDMAQWIRLNLGEGVYNGQKILSKDVIKEMQTPQTILRLDSLTQAMRPSTHFLSYGFGWALYDYFGKKVVSHDGALHGMRARVALVPEEKLGLVILMNSTRSTLHNALMFRVVDAYLGVPERDWSAEYLKLLKEAIEKNKAEEKKRGDERVKNTNPSLPLENYVGTYTSQMYGEAKIAPESGKLVMQFGPEYLGDLSHWHYDTFEAVWKRREWGKDTMVFSLNEKGKVGSLRWEGLGEFKKKDEK